MVKRLIGLEVKGFVMSVLALLLVSCVRSSRVDQYRAEKHMRDSIALTEQERSLAYYQSQLESLMPQVDSLLPLFNYEKDARYQDHGYYVATSRNGVRVKVRDDGRLPILIYREGKRLNSTDDPIRTRAEELQVVMSDVRELEKRIARTSLEINKYEKRLESYERE